MRWLGIALFKIALMPVGIDRPLLTSRVESGDLFFRQIPTERAKILPELLFVARADHDVAHRRTLQQPVERNLRNRLVHVQRDLLNRVDDFVQILVFNNRAAGGRQGRTSRGTIQIGSKHRAQHGQVVS